MFENISPIELIAGALAVISFFWPGYGVILMNKVKEWFGAEGRTANIIILVILGAVSAIALAVTGYFSGFELTFDNFIVLWGVLYALAQDAYQRIYGNKPEL